jgi:putative ABC transport system permease protein
MDYFKRQIQHIIRRLVRAPVFTLLTRFMSSILFGVSPADPGTYLAVSLALIGAAVAASYLPARRATSVNPVEALRSE